MRTHSRGKVNSLRPRGSIWGRGSGEGICDRVSCGQGSVLHSAPSRHGQGRGLRASRGPTHFTAPPTPIPDRSAPQWRLWRAGSSKHLTESSAVSYSFQSGMFTAAGFPDNERRGRPKCCQSPAVSVIRRFSSAGWLLRHLGTKIVSQCYSQDSKWFINHNFSYIF